MTIVERLRTAELVLLAVPGLGGTFIANIAGCLALGRLSRAGSSVVRGRTRRRCCRGDGVRPTGVFSSFTTYSTFALEAVRSPTLVGAGATVGGVTRYVTNGYLDRVATDRRFPYGTLTVNVISSFVLVLITFLGMESDVVALVGTGACGSYTTFSSFSIDTIRLWEDGDRILATWNTAANLSGVLPGIGLAAVAARV